MRVLGSVRWFVSTGDWRGDKDLLIFFGAEESEHSNQDRYYLHYIKFNHIIFAFIIYVVPTLCVHCKCISNLILIYLCHLNRAENIFIENQAYVTTALMLYQSISKL